MRRAAGLSARMDTEPASILPVLLVVEVTVKTADVFDLLVTAIDSPSIRYWLRRFEMPENEDDAEGDADGSMTEPEEHVYEGNHIGVVLPDGFDPDALAWRAGEEPWGDVSQIYFAPLVEGGKLLLFVDDDLGPRPEGTPPVGTAEDGGGVVTLDLAAIRRGLAIMAKLEPKHFADFLNEQYDATTADVFVQCCVFGEVVYG